MAMTLLIVDDHAGFRAVARRLFTLHGYEVVGEAPDGESALACVRDLRPDVVLLDVQLPDVDGFEVASRLTSSDDAPAVVMTSSRDGGDFGRLVEESGACGFIHKAELSGARLAELLE